MHGIIEIHHSALYCVWRSLNPVSTVINVHVILWMGFWSGTSPTVTPHWRAHHFKSRSFLPLASPKVITVQVDPFIRYFSPLRRLWTCCVRASLAGEPKHLAVTWGFIFKTAQSYFNSCHPSWCLFPPLHLVFNPFHLKNTLRASLFSLCNLSSCMKSSVGYSP